MRMSKLAASLLAGAAMVAGTAPAHAQASEPFIGQLMVTGANFCPMNWVEASGQLLTTSQNSALFSLLGTTYGGNGTTTFALPDLRGRVPNHVGQGPGLSSYVLGEQGGVETTTMLVNEMPQHTHVASVQTAGPVLANHQQPDGAAFGVTIDKTYVRPGTPVAGYDMAAGTVVNANAGGGQAQTNIPPYLTMRTCIALYGVFPSRN